MRRNILSAVYFLAHAVLFTALFLPPVFIPNHSMENGGEYGLWLAMELWPLSCLGAGILCACIPSTSGKVRVFSAAAGVMIAFVCLLCEGSDAPWLVCVYGLMYAAGFFAVRGIGGLVRSFCRSYKEYRERGMEK